METSHNPTIAHEKISERARRIWEAAGRPEGLDLEHWLAAERELRAETASRPRPPGAESVQPFPVKQGSAPGGTRPENSGSKVPRRKFPFA